MRSDFWLVLALASLPQIGLAQVVETSVGRLGLTAEVQGLEEPWALDFLPDGSVLMTELGGRLLAFSGDRLREIGGLPDVYLDGQGGLLDIMIPRDFETTREVWLTYAKEQSTGSGTAVGKGRLSDDGTTLEDFVTLFEMPEGSSGGRHFGSRLVEAADGSVFITIGDRGTGPRGMQAQLPDRAEGKIIHLNRDGTPATRLLGYLPGIYSSGHRNPQGATLDLNGRLLTVEHGARGGDELNAPVPGGNYGWPVISYGVNYGGRKIGLGQSMPGMEQPLHYWDPSIAPSGLMVYSGTLIPEWRGDIFFGSLNSDFLGRLDPDTAAATGFAEERISAPETGRVRDVVEGPDGAIWFLSVYDGAVYRMAPAE
ncbi:PQQ-dependent sugar dehydrogenase [Rhodobacter sp. SY28-1]|uniref:PQQ-dependent sugar dehydrogenase n=1 Tax=Rhodobacter sp. SY28-1 TaxID=2562317 RepID=UPI001F11650D|nr:PQQ-dependent sugar dehydrogenase [Rhodobacter sp. SY28-1]